MAAETIGLIGLGLMGGALAERLIAASYGLLAYDVDPARCEAVRRIGGLVAADHLQVASDCGRIVLSLPTSDVVEQVLRQVGAGLREGQTIVDTTTGDPQKIPALGERLAARGVSYLDATLSGSSAEAQQGNVIVIAGGPKRAFDACADLFSAFARRSFHMGDWGSGTRMKLVTNLILGLNRAALAEGLTFARSMGIDAELALAVLAEGAAYCRVMDTKGRKMIAGDFTPQARLSQHLKDVRLILAEAARCGSPLPLSERHRRLLEQVEAAGFGPADNSAIIRAFQNRAAEEKRSADGPA